MKNLLISGIFSYFLIILLIITNGQDIRTKWYILGPFPCGMNEIDGIPIIDSPNTKTRKQNGYNLPKFPTKSSIKTKYYTEFKQNGYTKWMKLTPNRNNQLQVQFPSIQWNYLVQSMHRTEVLQWQAWLTGQFKLKQETTVRITCIGLNTFWVNQVGPIASDQYSNRPFPYITILQPGTHFITSLIRSKHQTQLQCVIKAVDTSNKPNINLSVNPNFIPDLIDGKLSSSILGITIQNLSPNHQILLKNVDIIQENDYKSFGVSSTQPKWHLLYPNQISILPVYIDSISHSSDRCTILSIKLSFLFETQEEIQTTVTKQLDFNCRQQGQSFKFTFLDIDGSVQYAAAIHPLLNSSATALSLTKFPILINLHGTSVTASNSADSYKFKESSTQNDYSFGIENMWVLAPTRHGAHNWEGIGKNTAMQALKVLIEFTKQTVYPADETRIVFAGHSMGAHGTWILATSFPDLSLAVIPQAGWFRKEYYGDSNTLFLHDIQNSFVESQLKAIIEATIQENAIELHITNLKDIKCFVRVGSNDQVVHPWWSRRVVRLLHELYTNYNNNHPYIKYHEIPSKEHWWWDTKHANDGGVVNDAEIRLYLKEVLLQSIENEKKQLLLCSEHEFTLTIYNPSSVSSKNGIQILQTLKSYQKATLSVKCHSVCSCHVYTMNVRRLEIDLKILFSKWNNDLKLIIDDTIFEFNDNYIFMACSTMKNEWKQCINSINYSLTERSPISYGPIRQIFESEFRIVYGTNGSDKMKLKYKEWAIYLTNLWYMTGDCGNIRIHSDSEEANIHLNEKENILLIGDSLTNKWSKILLDNNRNLIDFQINKEFIQIGPCIYTKSFGFMLMFPIIHESNLHLGGIIGGSNLNRIYEIILMAKPTIPPMTRQPFSNTLPDYIVTNNQTFSKGFGAVLTAGFWKFDWKWDESTSYTSICQSDHHNKRHIKDEL